MIIRHRAVWGIVQTTLVAVAYFAAGRLSQAIATSPTRLSPLWPSAGIAVGSVIVYGRTAGFGVGLGSLAANLAYFHGQGEPWTVLVNALVTALGAVAEAWAAAVMVQKNLNVAVIDYFTRYRNVLRFTALAAVACGVSPFFGVTASWATGYVSSDGYVQAWLIWYAGDLVGVLLAAPLVLGLLTRPETMQPARATAQAAATLAWPNGVALVAHGNDGVGIVSAFASEAPDWLPMLVVGREDTASSTRIRAGAYRRVVLALLAQDDASRATVQSLRAAFAHQPCWRWAASGSGVIAYDRICGGD